MPQGLFSIGGIASGLDTSDIVTQLMQLERQPVTRLEQRQQDLQTTRDAWGDLNTRLSSLRSATDALRRPNSFTNLMSVSSSDPDAVAVTRGDRPVDASQLSFTVEQLATRMQQSSAHAFQGRDDLLDGRELLITPEGQTQAIDITAGLGPDATLDDLVNAVNDANVGVRASALQVRAGEFQLVLTAEDTGTANAFEVGGGGWGTDPLTVTQDAQDAQLTVGGIDVLRSSNTIDDLIEGATIELQRTTDQPVTVNAERDLDGAVERVATMVGELNKMMGKISELTDFDPESGESGPLQGQFAASQLAFSLRSAVTAPIEGLEGTASLASSVGISVDRNGRVQLDEDKLRQAFADDFEGTAQRFIRAGRSTDTDVAAQVGGARDTQAGTYGGEIARAAKVASATGSSYTPPGNGQPKSFTVRAPGGQLVTVQIDTSDVSSEQAALRIQQALDQAGVTSLTAGTDGDALTLRSTEEGSHTSFRVFEVDAEGEEIDGGTVFGLEGTHTGEDVEGTIDGVAAQGRGRTLTATEGPAAGLQVYTNRGLEVDAGAPRAFEATFSHGLGGAMDSELRRAEGSQGSIARARSSIDSQIQIYQDRIDAFEQRLESRETTLRRQFVAMEMAMDRFNSQGEWLQGQLAQLPSMGGQR